MSKSIDNTKKVSIDQITKPEYLKIQALCLKKMSNGIADYKITRSLRQEATNIYRRDEELDVSKNIYVVLDHIIKVLVHKKVKDFQELPCTKHKKLYSRIVRVEPIDMNDYTIAESIFAVQKYVQVDLKGLFPRPVIVSLIRILNNFNYFIFCDYVPYTIHWKVRKVFLKILYIFREVSKDDSFENYAFFHYASILFRSAFPKTSVINDFDYSRVFCVVEFLYQLDYENVPEEYSIFAKENGISTRIKKKLIQIKKRILGG